MPTTRRRPLVLLLGAVIGAVVGALVIGAGAAAGPGAAAQEPSTTMAGTGPVVLELYWGDGCPHCAAEKVALERLRREFPQLEVQAFEVWHDAANRARFVARARAAGIEAGAVPTTFIGDRVWVGFSDRIEDELRAELSARLGAVEADPDVAFPATVPTTAGPPTPEVVDVPLVGGVDVADTSLVTATVVIGFVDGVNPCSLWALSMLLAIVVHQASRRRVVAVGGTFLAVTTLLYGLYLVGLYSVLSFVAYLDAIRAVVAAVALVLGVINLKDGLGIRRGPSVRIAASAKPGLYRRMRRAAAGGSLATVIGSTAVLAVGVSLLETPCTLGLPLLWTNLLATRDVGPAAAAGLFVLYMVVFLLDELVVFAAAVVTLRATKVQERHGRALELVGGSLMVTLAVVLLVAPSLLESVTGAVAVLAAAGLLAGVLWLGSRALGDGGHAGGGGVGRGDGDRREPPATGNQRAPATTS